MTGDPGNGPTAAPQPDRDPEATQAWIPAPDGDHPMTAITPDGPQWSAESLLPMSDVEMDADRPQSSRAPSAAEPTALDLLFAEERFVEVDELVPGARSAGSGTGVPVAERPARPPMSALRRQRILLAVGAGAVGLLVLSALFLLGTRLPGLASTPVIEVTAAPVPSNGAAIAPVPPGVYPWDELRGGECLDPYTDPWAAEFTVVDCLKPHTAQLTLHGSYLDALGVVTGTGELTLPAYPGVDALAAGIDELCAAGVDFDAARDITDGQMQGSFPTTEEEWGADPSYRCFFSRSSGADLTGSVSVT